MDRLAVETCKNDYLDDKDRKVVLPHFNQTFYTKWNMGFSNFANRHGSCQEMLTQRAYCRPGTGFLYSHPRSPETAGSVPR